MQGRSANRLLGVFVAGVLAWPAATPAADDTDSVSGASAGVTHECPMHDRYHGGAAPDAMLQQFRDELGLTGQQQTDLQIIVSDYGERFRDLAELARKTAEELMSISPDDPGYRAKTDEASALAASSAAETVILLAEMRGKLHAVLTEAQRQLLQQKIAERKQQLEEKKRQRELEKQSQPESHDRPLEQFIG